MLKNAIGDGKEKLYLPYCNDSELDSAKSKEKECDEIKAKERDEEKAKEQEEIKAKERDEIKVKEREEEKAKESEVTKAEERKEEKTKELDERGSPHVDKGLRVGTKCQHLTGHTAANCPIKMADEIAKEVAAAERIKTSEVNLKPAADIISASERQNEKVLTTLAGKPKIKNIQTITSTKFL